MPQGTQAEKTTEPKTILVTGATGTQGGAVTRALLDRGHNVKAMTRNPDAESAKELERLGATPVEGDFNKPDTIQQAAQGVDAAYAMSTPYEEGPDTETEQGKQLVKALDEAGVPHIVYASVASADQETGIPFFDSKVPVEECVANECEATHTVVAPVFFRENLLTEDTLKQLDDGNLVLALPEDTALQTIGADEIGRFARYAFENPDEMAGRRVDIASDELTGPEMAARLTDATGERITFQELPLNDLKEQNPGFGTMFEWFQQEGYDVDVRQLKTEYDDVSWQTFDQWANDQDWQRLMGREATPPTA